MTQPLFQSEQVAAEWASRICNRLQELNLPSDEIEETRSIIFAFTKVAADELSRERKVTLPYTDEIFEIDQKHAHQIIDLFLRGINHTSKKLRNTGKPWDERKTVMEALAWKLFNLSKLLVGFLYIPNPAMKSMLNSPKDLQLMMKQSSDMLLQEELGGGPANGFPFNLPRF